MKYVLLSADSLISVYSVPCAVADNLEEYCYEFCSKWLWKSPHAEKYRVGIGVCYCEHDFIEYLNTWIFPNNPSKLIETLDVYDISNVPEKYKHFESFNF